MRRRRSWNRGSERSDSSQLRVNHSNFLSPINNSTLFNQDGSATGGAGLIDMTSTTNREIQFALKLIF
jgi:hypothetical protein